jgi:hypothetical protein
MSLKIITSLLLAVIVASAVKVESVGFKYKTSALSESLALDAGAVADVTLGYKLPMLSDR